MFAVRQGAKDSEALRHMPVFDRVLIALLGLERHQERCRQMQGNAASNAELLQRLKRDLEPN